MLPLLLALTLAVAAPEGDAPSPVNPFEEPDEGALYKLDQQLVTVASRYAQTLRKAPSIVTLVDAEQIRERGYRTLSDLLRDLPGIYLWKSQEGRDIASFRGVISADNNKILLLVDGVPWYDGVYTHAFVDDFLPISHIKQVEVIKGPGSAIYGTNAFAGVINVVTWDPEDLEGGGVRWVAGSRGRSDLTGLVGAKTQVGALPVGVSAYARWYEQLGDGLDLTPRGRRDINGYDPKRGLNVGARLHLGDLTMQVHHVDYRHTFLINELNDPHDALAKDLDAFGLYYHDTFFSARYDLSLGRALTLRPHFFTQRHDNPGSYWFHQGFSTTESEPGVFETQEHQTTIETGKDTRRWGAGLDVEARPGIDHVIVGGIGIENVGIVDDPDGAPGIIDRMFVDGAQEGVPTGFEGSGRLRNVYGFAQYAWTLLPELEITAGGRFDMRIPSNPDDDRDADAFNPNLTPRLGVLLVPYERLTMKLLYGRAFRQPNARELLVQATITDDQGNYQFSSGNLDLRPERIDTMEGEVNWTIAPPLTVRVDGYASFIQNEIDKVVPPNQYQNLPGVLRVLGGEAQIIARAGPVTLDAAYALTEARYGDDAGPYAGFPQYEFPPHMAKGSATWRVTPNLTMLAFGEWYGYRPRAEWGADVERADGSWFGLVHASVRVHALGKRDQLEVTATVRNLTDTVYGTAMYREDANTGSGGVARYPGEIEGEGRSVTVSLQGMF